MKKIYIILIIALLVAVIIGTVIGIKVQEKIKEEDVSKFNSTFQKYLQGTLSDDDVRDLKKLVKESNEKNDKHKVDFEIKDELSAFNEYEVCKETDKDGYITKLNVNYTFSNYGGADYKPIIYLYPTEDTEVTVKVGRPENLLYTYPKYENEWKVLAQPNGDLVDLKTGRKLYCLYWEGLNTTESTMEEGFVIKGEDTISFLEEKLAILGLNEREANEFIIYWLPKLESNKYNYIRFETKEQIDENMPLEIDPTPDTVIRIVMEFKALDNPIEVKEQKLETPVRIGFTVVEWGGTELK